MFCAAHVQTWAPDRSGHGLKVSRDARASGEALPQLTPACPEDRTPPPPVVAGPLWGMLTLLSPGHPVPDRSLSELLYLLGYPGRVARIWIWPTNPSKSRPAWGGEGAAALPPNSRFSGWRGDPSPRDPLEPEC